MRRATFLIPVGVAVAAACALGACGSSGSKSPAESSVTCAVDDAGAIVLGAIDPSDAGDEAGSPVIAVTADQDAVYVVTETSDYQALTDIVDVYRIPRCGGSPTPLVSRSAPAMTGGASTAFVSSGRVFVVMGDGIYSVPTTGGAMTTETTSGAAFGAPVVPYGDDIYWLDTMTPTIWVLTTGGGHTPRVVAQGMAAPSPAWPSFAVDGKNAYVVAIPRTLEAGTSGPADEDNGSIVALPLDGGLPATLASSQSHPTGLIEASGSLYWATSVPVLPMTGGQGISTGTIQSLLLPGGPARGVVINQNPAPSQLMMVGTTLYWIGYEGPSGEDTIGAQPPSGPPTVRSPGILGQDSLTLAGSGAYWWTLTYRIYGMSL